MAHLNDFVKIGTVNGGDLIAHAGNTGNSSGDHMHVSRACDGQPAPLVLSGREIVPVAGAGAQYSSSGPILANITIGGVLDGMVYYQPVTIAFSCSGADPGTLVGTLDGAAVTTGVVESDPGPHRLTISASVSGRVTTREVTFTVAPPPAPGLEPVFRFYRPSRGTHFFTPTHGERDNVVACWSHTYTYEGVAYWVNPVNNTQPLYRFYNRNSNSHFYTASGAERDAVIRQWPSVLTYEGETYRVSPTSLPGATTVYRFYHLKNGSHFFTASAEERDIVISRWPTIYRYEGEAFRLAQ